MGEPEPEPELERVLERDKEQFPDCWHSQHVQQSVRSVNGDTQSELLRQFFRNCPGKRPVQIYATRSVDSVDSAGDAGDSGEFGFGVGADGLHEQLEEAMRESFGPLAALFGLSAPAGPPAAAPVPAPVAEPSGAASGAASASASASEDVPPHRRPRRQWADEPRNPFRGKAPSARDQWG